MDFSDNEIRNTLLTHAVVGLSREDLIGSQWAYGDPEGLRHIGRQVGYQGPERGLVVSPSMHGAELFLHAMGAGHLPLNIFLHEGVSFSPIEGIAVQSGSQPVIQPAGVSK